MNRRQFLTGTSALAVSAALPAASVVPDWREVMRRCNIDTGFAAPAIVSFYAGRVYWITGKDNVIHWLDPRDVEIA